MVTISKSNDKDDREGDVDYLSRIDMALSQLGISRDSLVQRNLTIFAEAAELCVAEVVSNGREHLLLPSAAEAWRQLRTSASSDGIVLHIVSAYRSFDRQQEIFCAKLARGLDVETILRVSAPPGYSEHHTGRAIDVGTLGCRDLEENFENTPAFLWLVSNARKFGFSLSYPRNNTCGYAYEPWHWYWNG